MIYKPNNIKFSSQPTILKTRREANQNVFDRADRYTIGSISKLLKAEGKSLKKTTEKKQAKNYMICKPNNDRGRKLAMSFSKQGTSKSLHECNKHRNEMQIYSA